MAGNQMAGMEKLKLGMKALMEALPMLPIGSEISNAVMKAATDIGKHLSGGGEGGDPQAAIQMLAAMAQAHKAQPSPQGAAMGMMGGGMPPGGGGAPPPPGMGAGPPPLGG
jgi:hypothetical protein